MNKVTLDLPGAMDRLLLSAQDSIWLRSSLRAVVRVGRSGEDSPTVKSAAKGGLRAACWGKSETKKLKREGEMTEPWGTPEWIVRKEDSERAEVTGSPTTTKVGGKPPHNVGVHRRVSKFLNDLRRRV